MKRVLYLNLMVLTLAFMALVAPFAQMAPAQTPWYVATNGTGGGTSWADATNSIQGAIVASSAGDTVWVSNGVYEAGGVTNFPTGTLLTNRVAIYKAITVRSKDNDPANTIIRGAWDPVTTNGPAAVRCVYMTNGSSLIGFTLTNGATLTTGSDERGGGIYSQSTNTVISNCVLSGNSAASYGGGAMYGTLFNCTLNGNSAYYRGGGVYAGTLSNCTLTVNSTTYAGADSKYGGGGAFGGTLYNCTLTSNSAKYGGGVNGQSWYAYDYAATLSNCTLIGNSAVSWGGGAQNAKLYNCTLTNNSAGASGYGGGAYNAILYNCTIANNSAMWCGGAGGSYSTQYNCTLSGNGASQGGGGAYYGTLYNCLLTNNSSSSGNGGGGAYGGTFYNCTLVNNVNPYYGGGAMYGALYNCKLIGNYTYWGGDNGGGGAYGSTLYNCTVSGNWSRYDAGLAGVGGGVRGGSLINCIVYGNSAYTAGASNWYAVVTFTNTCTAPEATNGVGNITFNPLFVDTNAANYRLSVYSPALNVGTNFTWMTDPTDVRSKDLDGQRRIDNFSRQVDMGCYELMQSGTMFTFK